MNYTQNTAKVNGQEISFWRVNNDVNGNPRYVIHFLDVLSQFDKDAIPAGMDRIATLYKMAIKKIHDAIGGQKYRAKWFGGGLVFQSYRPEHDLERIIPAS